MHQVQTTRITFTKAEHTRAQGNNKKANRNLFALIYCSPLNVKEHTFLRQFGKFIDHLGLI